MCVSSLAKASLLLDEYMANLRSQRSEEIEVR
jgi:hypothetical protein